MGVKFFCCALGFFIAQAIQAQPPVAPSPWWLIDRFGKNLVIATTIDQENQRLILTIDSGVWANLDYLGRYSTLHHLSQSTIPYGYSLLLQTPRKTIVAVLNKSGQLEPSALGALPFRANPIPLR
jgi:hypothetical protein